MACRALYGGFLISILRRFCNFHIGISLFPEVPIKFPVVISLPEGMSQNESILGTVNTGVNTEGNFII